MDGARIDPVAGDAFSATYLGMGDPRSGSISALNQKPPLRCCRRGVHPSSMAATVSMAVALVPPPLCLGLWRSFCCARWCRVLCGYGKRIERGIECFYRQGGNGKKKKQRRGCVVWGGKSSLEGVTVAIRPRRCLSKDIPRVA